MARKLNRKRLSMNKVLYAVLLVCFFLQGCDTNSSSKLSDLETKLEALESKVDMIAQKQEADEGYYTELINGKIESLATKIAEPETKVSAVSVTEKDIQLALTKAGYYKGAIDGKIGPNTEKAIREFQKANSLKADGIAGPNTRNLLAKYLSSEDEKILQ
ncbi:MAG: hypothetical protein A2Z72_02755 [Omnitrophica bacterium RBG_13_46_9]|nr:MAG: hypothetical protein A2Z72_02755 [Omnitrophica bacterium RBG_13_46_9]